MNDIEAFIRDAATKRGIDPEIAIKVAQSEGGITEYARRGTFATGKSFWQFQLHYGGEGYEQYGTVAGMGTGFTVLTGWQPGDPKAWRDSVRYALNRAKLGGWSPWYGAAHVGISQWDGINRDYPWNAASERWDYEDGVTPMAVVYDPNVPPIAQDDGWSCAPTSLRWALTALGRSPGPTYVEDLMLRDGVVTKEHGLMDATGAGLAAWIGKTGQEYYGSDGFYGNHEPAISWDWIVHEGGQPDGSRHQYPVLIGGRAWGHWSAVRDFDPARGVLLLANPGDGWMGVGQTMSLEQFAALGPFSAVRVLHPELFEQPVPAPPAPPVDTRIPRARAKILEALAILDEPVPG